jgi:hypothetical protein
MVLFVDNVSNELDLACALKHVAWERFGMEIAIESLKSNLSTTLEQWETRAIAVPSFSSRHDSGVQEILNRWTDVRIVNLDLSWRVGADDHDDILPRDQYARSHAVHLASNDRRREALLASGVPADRVAITGSLTCGLYQEPYRNLFSVQRRRLAAQYALDPDRSWLLLTTHHGHGAKLQHVRSDSVSRSSTHGALHESPRASLMEIGDWCRAGAEAGRCEIIVRSDDQADVEAIRNHVEESVGEAALDRLHFVNDDSHRHWIMASDAVLTTDSNVLIEAAVAERPAYLLSPETKVELRAGGWRENWNEMSSRIRTGAEFVNLVRRGPTPFSTSVLRQWVHRELLGNGDPLSAAVSMMASVVGGSHYIPPAPTLPVLDRLQLRWRNSSFSRRRVKAQNSCRQPHSTLEFHRESFAAEVARRMTAWQQVISLPQRLARVA